MHNTVILRAHGGGVEALHPTESVHQLEDGRWGVWVEFTDVPPLRPPYFPLRRAAGFHLVRQTKQELETYLSEQQQQSKQYLAED
jgi:hypothetical protein